MTTEEQRGALRARLLDIICFESDLPIGYDARWDRSDAEGGVTAIMEAIEEHYRPIIEAARRETCENCQVEGYASEMYRCFHCKNAYCGTCARPHFGENPIWENSPVKGCGAYAPTVTEKPSDHDAELPTLEN